MQQFVLLLTFVVLISSLSLSEQPANGGSADQDQLIKRGIEKLISPNYHFEGYEELLLLDDSAVVAAVSVIMQDPNANHGARYSAMKVLAKLEASRFEVGRAVLISALLDPTVSSLAEQGLIKTPSQFKSEVVNTIVSRVEADTTPATTLRSVFALCRYIGPPAASALPMLRQLLLDQTARVDSVDMQAAFAYVRIAGIDSMLDLTEQVGSSTLHFCMQALSMEMLTHPYRDSLRVDQAERGVRLVTSLLGSNERWRVMAGLHWGSGIAYAAKKFGHLETFGDPPVPPLDHFTKLATAIMSSKSADIEVQDLAKSKLEMLSKMTRE